MMGESNFSRWADLALADAGETVKELRVTVGPQKLVSLRENSFCITNGDGKVIMFSELAANAKSDFRASTEIKARKKFSEEQENEIRELLKSGKSSGEIAEQFGCDPRRIGCRRHLLKLELSKKPHTNQPSVQVKRDARGRLIWTKALIAEARKFTGGNIQAFADKYGISKGAALSGKYHK